MVKILANIIIYTFNLYFIAFVLAQNINLIFHWTKKTTLNTYLKIENIIYTTTEWYIIFLAIAAIALLITSIIK